MKDLEPSATLPASDPVSTGTTGPASRLGWWLGRILGGHTVTAQRFVTTATVLFLALVTVKVILLGSFGKHLFQSHWRTGSSPPGWFGQVNYYLFLTLLMATFALLGRDARTWSKRQIRLTHVGLLVVGLVFAFFTFTAIGHNYLYPLANGLLTPANILQYVELNFFYGRPFLAAYLVIFAVGYRVLVAGGREHWAFPLFGALAVLYALVNLGDLRDMGAALSVVNCFGVAALIAWCVKRGPLDWRLQLVPFVLAAAGWLAMSPFEESVADPDACFRILFAVAAGLFVVAYALVRRGAGFGLVSHLLPFYFAAFLLLSNRRTPLADNYNQLIIWGLTLARYVTGEFLLCLLLLLAAVWVARQFPRLAIAGFDAAAIALTLVALVDLRLSQTMAIRLDWNAIVVANSPLMLWRTIEPFAGQAALGLAVLVGVYFFFARLALRWLSGRVDAIVTGRVAPPCYVPLALGLLACVGPFLLGSDKATGTALANVASTSPAARGVAVERLGQKEFAEAAARFGFALPHEARHRRPEDAPADLNLLLIVMESTHTRYLSLFGAADETQPLLKKYRDRMELFPDFWSNFPNSFHARFATLNGLLAPKDYVTHVAPRLPAPNLHEVLYARGWTNSAFDSCSRDYVRWNDYLSHRGLDVFHDCDSMPGREKHQRVSWGVSESATLEAITNRIAFHARQGGRFTITYLPVAPHMPFDSPTSGTGFDKFTNGFGQLDGNFVGRYKNQLLYLDWIITSMIESLEAHGLLDKTLVVISNDHGEMLGEDAGRVGHGWNLDPRLCHSPLIIMDPRRPGYRVNPTRGSQPDLLPTILDRLNVAVPHGELYQGVSLDSEAAKQPRPIWFNSYGHRAMITGNRFIVEENGLGNRHGGGPVRVYDILNDGVKTSFQEIENLPKPDVAAKFNDLERYQKSLIVHYAYYRELAAQLALRDAITQARP